MRLARWLLIIVAVFALAAAPQAGKKGTQGKSGQKSEASTSKKSALIDINSATEKELKELPGIGDAYAAKIMAGRPYRAKNQLIQKKIIPQATYEKIKDQIFAKQPGSK
jgi:competence protein ComEA